MASLATPTATASTTCLGQLGDGDRFGLAGFPGLILERRWYDGTIWYVVLIDPGNCGARCRIVGSDNEVDVQLQGGGPYVCLEDDQEVIPLS